MAQQGSGSNDAFTGSAMQFMQAGQNMAQQFIEFFGKAGNPGAANVPPVDPAPWLPLPVPADCAPRHRPAHWAC